ncbi:MAG: 8-amino-7-oxononanoate synthase [Colwellia sp.]
MSFDFISKQLAAQQQQSRYRQRVCIQENNFATDAKQQGAQINIEGKQYINFSSNDYLGLNNHVEINKAMQEGIDKFGLCASASNLVTGFNYAHQALEDEICQWLNKPHCLLFSSGFSANLALFHALGQSDCYFYLDKLSHASMLDGAFSSKAKVKRFDHNNMQQLGELLSGNKTNTNVNSNNRLIASEGVFSMDGDQAHVAQLSQLAKQHNAWLYLDDAHSIGVIGDKGQGSACFINNDTADITMATFGKAIATSGAFLVCEQALHDYLINFSRHYIYSTAMSPALAWATKKSIAIIQKEQWRRDKIVELNNLLTELLDPSIKLISSQSAIQAIIVGDEVSALLISEQLRKQGIWLTAIRPPTVPVNGSRLRVTITAKHNIHNIRHLAKYLNKAFA